MSELDLSPAAVVARTLAKLRAAGLLRPELAPAAPVPAGPTRGPRRCPQRRCNKKVLKGPRARRPLRSGQHAPKVSTLSRMAGLQEEPSTTSDALTL
jgi:hypothetical protein